MNQIGLFKEYLDNLEEYRSRFLPLFVRGDNSGGCKKITDYLIVNFDDFRNLLKTTEVYDFPTHIDGLLGLDWWTNIQGTHFNYSEDGYLASSSYRRLKVSQDLLLKRLKERSRERWSPVYWVKRIVTDFIRLPYNVIVIAGFNPNSFIDSGLGKIFAWIFLFLFMFGFLYLVGFSVDQMAKLLKLIVE